MALKLRYINKTHTQSGVEKSLLQFSLSSYLALKLGYIYKKNTYTQSVAENSLFQLCLTFSPFYLEEIKNYESLVISRTVNQLIMRVRKPKVEYKLALQEKPKGEP